MRGALHQMIRAGDLSGVEAVLRKYPQAVNQLAPFFISPLHEACRSGQQPVVEFLLSQGADVHARYVTTITARGISRQVAGMIFSVVRRDQWNRTPIWIASWWGRCDLIELLLDAGAGSDLAFSVGLRLVSVFCGMIKDCMYGKHHDSRCDLCQSPCSSGHQGAKCCRRGSNGNSMSSWRKGRSAGGTECRSKASHRGEHEGDLILGGLHAEFYCYPLQPLEKVVKRTWFLSMVCRSNPCLMKNLRATQRGRRQKEQVQRSTQTTSIEECQIQVHVKGSSRAQTAFIFGKKYISERC